MRLAIDGPFGNPSSDHWAGIAARDAVDRARAQIAALLRCEAEEIVFTSGGSEANNLVIKAIFFATCRPCTHTVTTTIEHPSVTNGVRFLEPTGAAAT